MASGFWPATSLPIPLFGNSDQNLRGDLGTPTSARHPKNAVTRNAFNSSRGPLRKAFISGTIPLSPEINNIRSWAEGSLSPSSHRASISSSCSFRKHTLHTRRPFRLEDVQFVGLEEFRPARSACAQSLLESLLGPLIRKEGAWLTPVGTFTFLNARQNGAHSPEQAAQHPVWSLYYRDRSHDYYHRSLCTE